MGHKVHPLGFRIGVIRDWQAKWYADKHFAENLLEDVKLRQAIQARYAEAGISLVEIERQANEVSLTIHTARPGVVIGRGGQRVDEMRLYLETLIGKRVRLTIREIQQPELDAYLVARTIAEQIERRVAYRRAMKQAVFRTSQAGAKGVRISCSGRLGGAEIARRQTTHQGQVPLHTLRADIDYGFTEACTTLGRIGIKVWIYKGDILPEPKVAGVTEIPAELVAGERVEAAPLAEPEEKPVEPVADISAEAVEPVSIEQAEKDVTEIPAEPVVSKREEVAPSAEPQKKVAKPAARRRTRAKPAGKPDEKPVEPVADISVEAVEPASIEQAEKDVTEIPALPVVSKREEVAPSAEPQKKVAKPAARRRTRAKPAGKPAEKPVEPVVDISAEAVEPASVQLEEGDVTAETGEIPQEP